MKKLINRTAVQEIPRVSSYSSSLHQSILTIIAIHGERLPHHNGGTHYAYAQADDLTDATEIENHYKDEDAQ